MKTTKMKITTKSDTRYKPPLPLQKRSKLWSGRSGRLFAKRKLNDPEITRRSLQSLSRAAAAMDFQQLQHILGKQ
jgi:hypothetical protein